MFSIFFSKNAEKQLDKLEEPIKYRIVSAIERIKVRPYYFVRRLVGCPYYRLRVGDYRIIMDIKEENLIILVIEIGHRKKIYKN